jgi:general secretion pathway protein B
MSYILDALKKVEHEKNKKAQSPGKINIAGDLFHERAQPKAKVLPWKAVALIAVVAVVASAGTWFAVTGNGKKNDVVRQQRVVPTPAATPVLVPSSPPQPVSAPPAPPPMPAIRETSENNNAASPPQKTSRIEKQPARQVIPQSLVPAPADIKLSGIAWQDERSARRAVVNGFLLKEGTVVSGATIVDIQANKVRFSSGAGQFEVALDAALTGSGK